MPTLDDLRAQGEAELEQILAGLDAKYRKALKAAVEYYGRVEDIPEIFWVEMEREIEAEQVAALTLLILAADEWTGDEIERQGASIVSTPDKNRATRAANDQLRGTSSQTVDTIRKRLADKVRDARTTGPGDLGELTKRGLQRAVNDVLTKERRQGIATDETTKAFSAGQKAARDRLGGDGAITDAGQRVTIELYWVTEQDNLVCKTCRPYHDTPESVWGQAFPDGPGPQVHPNCRCSLRPVVIVQAPVTESTADDGEGRWITIRGNAVKISDDGTVLTGPLKGKQLGSKGTQGGGRKSERPDSERPTTKPRGPERKDSVKSARAKKAYNPSTKEKQDASEELEHVVTKALGGTKSGDNQPMDVTAKGGKIGLEVKMVHDGKDDKVHMRRDSRLRKEAWVAEKKGRKAYTVIIDNRDKFEGGKHKSKYSGNRIYWKEGVGAFRFAGMNTAKNLADLKQQLGL